jgi:excisionase family DNA binding protein
MKEINSNTLTTLKNNPELARHVTIQVIGIELLQFADEVALKTAQAVEKRIREENKPDELLTRQEAAERLRVTLTTLWHWEKKQILVPVKIGNIVRYRKSDVDKTLERRKSK